MGPWKKLLGLAFDAYWADPENDTCPPMDPALWLAFRAEAWVLTQEGHRKIHVFFRVRQDQADLWGRGDHHDQADAILSKVLKVFNASFSESVGDTGVQIKSVRAWTVRDGAYSPYCYEFRFNGKDIVSSGMTHMPPLTWSDVRIPQGELQVEYAEADCPDGTMALRHMREWLVLSLTFMMQGDQRPIMGAARIRLDTEVVHRAIDYERQDNWHNRMALALYAVTAIVRAGIVPAHLVDKVVYFDSHTGVATDIHLDEDGQARGKVGGYSFNNESLVQEPDGVRVVAPVNGEIEIARQVGEEVCSLLFNRYLTMFKQPHYEALETLGKQQYKITVIKGAGVMYPKFTVQVACGEASASFNWQSGLGDELIGSCELEFHLPTSGSGDELRRTMNNVEAIGVLESRWLAVLMKHLRKVEMPHLEQKA